ncbi:fungal-specific transcription factor domain-containing protein [Fusarium tricinctum]|uniref:Fungal-specific transcription factor domain-containing protein n=1 Tax=Fusarium tricinctum TaxID=61284 RepID=A0A8K0WFX3_9HYPO|nr:fungal-specific transcription factor domain-containing protein [Fusarium tricinctum]
MLSSLQPAVSKACSRCRARKVKCDLKIPQCSSCVKQNEVCNITDCVSYPYSVVKALQDRINDLEARLHMAETPNVPVVEAISESTLNNQPTPANLQKEAEEVGFLTTGGSDLYSGSKYVGSAAGSTFARIFFKQLNIIPSWDSGQQRSGLDQSLSLATAALPPQPIARPLLNLYIARVHIWWPFLQLPHLRRVMQHIYEDPRQCSDHEKFIVFIVLALGSSRLTSKDSQSAAIMDLNDTNAYFQTALLFFNNFHTHPRDLFGIQAVLLLAIWMLDSSHSSHNNDLWQLSRYIMSVAIEAGLHRHNMDWGFTLEELEVRNRTWWCAYNLERQVATLTGRVLSIRDHAVHAMLPSSNSFDNLTPLECSTAPILHKHGVVVFRHMITLRKIGGRILESIYIARGPNGTAMDTTFQQICATSDQIRRDLELWEQQLEAMALKPSREYSEMKIEYCMLQLLLHRPSPTFMVPSRQMASYCSKAASTAINQWSKIVDEYGISAVCQCFRQLHDIVLVGLAALYCDWQALALPQAVSDKTTRTHRHLSDTNICLNLIDSGISHMKARHLEKFRHIFQAVRNKVYSKPTFSGISPTGSTAMSSILSPESVDALSQNLIFNPNNDIVYSMGDGVEAYVNQVSEFLDGGGFNADEALDAWYDALMGEIQNGDSQMT